MYLSDVETRRRELSLTQKALAEAAGMTPQQYNRLVKGAHGATEATIKRLAKALETLSPEDAA